MRREGRACRRRGGSYHAVRCRSEGAACGMKSGGTQDDGDLITTQGHIDPLALSIFDLRPPREKFQMKTAPPVASQCARNGNRRVTQTRCLRPQSVSTAAKNSTTRRPHVASVRVWRYARIFIGAEIACEEVSCCSEHKSSCECFVGMGLQQSQVRSIPIRRQGWKETVGSGCMTCIVRRFDFDVGGCKDSGGCEDREDCEDSGHL